MRIILLHTLNEVLNFLRSWICAVLEAACMDGLGLPVFLMSSLGGGGLVTSLVPNVSPTLTVAELLDVPSDCRVLVTGSSFSSTRKR